MELGETENDLDDELFEGVVPALAAELVQNNGTEALRCGHV